MAHRPHHLHHSRHPNRHRHPVALGLFPVLGAEHPAVAHVGRVSVDEADTTWEEVQLVRRFRTSLDYDLHTAPALRNKHRTEPPTLLR